MIRLVAYVIALFLFISPAYASDVDYTICWFSDVIHGTTDFDIILPTEKYFFSYDTTDGSIECKPLEGYIVQGEVPGEGFYFVLANDHSIPVDYYSYVLSYTHTRRPFDIYHVTNNGTEIVADDIQYEDLAAVLAYIDGVLYYCTSFDEIIAVHGDERIKYDYLDDNKNYTPFIDTNGNIYYWIDEYSSDYVIDKICESPNIDTFELPAIVSQSSDGNITILDIDIRENIVSYIDIYVSQDNIVYITALDTDNNKLFIKYHLSDHSYSIASLAHSNGNDLLNMTVLTDELLFINTFSGNIDIRDHIGTFDMETQNKSILFDCTYSELDPCYMFIDYASEIGVLKINTN